MPGQPQHSPAIHRIVLTGFMGAGKTTAGRAIALRLGWEFVDVDAFLSEKHEASVAELFSAHTEAGFRELEAEAIRLLLKRTSLVVALGGGALEDAGTRELLAAGPYNLVVYLEAPLDVMLERCAAQPGAAVRPLLQNRASLAQRLENRLPHYRNAHLTIATSGLSPDEVADRIEEALQHAVQATARYDEEKNG